MLDAVAADGGKRESEHTQAFRDFPLSVPLSKAVHSFHFVP